MILKSKNIILRELNEKDININYFNWFKDKGVKKYIVHTSYKNLDDLKFYVKKINK